MARALDHPLLLVSTGDYSENSVTEPIGAAGRLKSVGLGFSAPGVAVLKGHLKVQVGLLKRGRQQRVWSQDATPSSGIDPAWIVDIPVKGDDEVQLRMWDSVTGVTMFAIFRFEVR